MTDASAPLFTAVEIAAITGATLVGEPKALVGSVIVDSRKAVARSLFVALPGERVDGHSYIDAAIESGASCVLARSERRAEVEAASLALADRKGTALAFVPDSLAALQALARAHRRRFPRLLRIGVTGSSGKSTTKECIAAVLGRSRAIIFNPGNMNSDIGLSLSIFSIVEAHQAGIFEMGMNRSGEMGELASVLEPDIALITNIGTAHIGILGSRDAIAKEKKKIFSRFDGRQAGFVWEGDDYRDFLKSGVPGDMADFGPRSTVGMRILGDRGLEGYDLSWDGIEFRFSAAGTPQSSGRDRRRRDGFPRGGFRSRRGERTFVGEAAFRTFRDTERRVYHRARLLQFQPR